MLVCFQVQTDRAELHTAGAALAAALVAGKHQVNMIYFHDQGVRVVNSALSRIWKPVIDAGVSLLVCSAGLTARKLDRDELPQGFASAGLTLAFDHILAAQRCVTFR